MEESSGEQQVVRTQALFTDVHCARVQDLRFHFVKTATKEKFDLQLFQDAVSIQNKQGIQCS